MSKASEYAKVYAEYKNHVDKRPRFSTTLLDFGVSFNGDLVLPGEVKLSPEDALKLSAWIFETFGEHRYATCHICGQEHEQ